MGDTKVVSKQGTVRVKDGVELDLICSYFGDRVFLIITHLNKIGTMVREKRRKKIFF